MKCKNCGRRKPGEALCNFHKSALPPVRTCGDWQLAERCLTCSSFNMIAAECSLTGEPKSEDDECGSWTPVEGELIVKRQANPPPPPPPKSSALERSSPVVEITAVVVYALLRPGTDEIYFDKEFAEETFEGAELVRVVRVDGQYFCIGNAVRLIEKERAVEEIRSRALSKLTPEEIKVLGLGAK